jgi:hypothetical protein
VIVQIGGKDLLGNLLVLDVEHESALVLSQVHQVKEQFVVLVPAVLLDRILVRWPHEQIVPFGPFLFVAL